MTFESFRCVLVRQQDDGQTQTGVVDQPRSSLPEGDVLLRVRYSSLNYKDAMAATGHRAIAKNLPHIPGIDAVGTVLESRDERFAPGDEVIATGHEFGVERWGGWAELLSCPADWLVPLPSGLSSLEAMTLGTAGFTAAQCVLALLHQGVTPDAGQVVVSGATGGVGSLAVMLLAHLGFQVVAVTGKEGQQDWLKSIGASEIAGRELLSDPKGRPLLSGKFAAGVDTVGGDVLATMCKQISHRGCVACCGMAGGADLNMTVYPFILRGVTLAGIDSAWCPDSQRAEIWKRLANEWKLSQLGEIRQVVTLENVLPCVERILQGENVGRVVVQLAGESP